MIIRDDQIRYGAVFEPVPRLLAFRRKTPCDLCELWITRCSEKWRVTCVNFGRSAPREKRSVICVNFGLSPQSITMGRAPVLDVFLRGRLTHA